MHSCVTRENVKWCHLIWPTLYSGAVPWRHRYTSTVSLNCTRSATSSQWSSSCNSHAIELPSVANDAGSRVHCTLQLVCCDLQ